MLNFAKEYLQAFATDGKHYKKGMLAWMKTTESQSR